MEISITRTILENLRPVSPLPSKGVLSAALFSLAVVSAAIGVCCFGDAGWKALSHLQAAGIFLALGLAVAIMSRIAVDEMIPGRRHFLPVAPTLAFVILGLTAVIIILFPHHHDDQFFTRGFRCWGIGFGFSCVAATLFAFVLRHSAWLSPRGLGAATGLLSGLVGLSVLEVFCPFLDRAHIGIWHLGSVVSSLLIGYCIGFLTPKFAGSSRLSRSNRETSPR